MKIALCLFVLVGCSSSSNISNPLSIPNVCCVLADYPAAGSTTKLAADDCVPDPNGTGIQSGAWVAIDTHGASQCAVLPNGEECLFNPGDNTLPGRLVHGMIGACE